MIKNLGRCQYCGAEREVRKVTKSGYQGQEYESTSSFHEGDDIGDDYLTERRACVRFLMRKLEEAVKRIQRLEEAKFQND